MKFSVDSLNFFKNPRRSRTHVATSEPQKKASVDTLAASRSVVSAARIACPPVAQPLPQPAAIRAGSGPAPSNPLVSPMLTDFYQINMAYALYKAQRHNAPETFELYFRKNPFGGEFTIFAGLHEVAGILNTFRFTSNDVTYLRANMPEAAKDAGFFAWLQELDCSQVTVHALREGSVAFPSVPLLRIEGPAAVCRLLETTLLNAVNFPSLVATNAVRHKLAVGPGKGLIEGGLRRAQGPDGAITASRYAYLGGFDATSNVRSGQMFGIPVRGTHAHSYITHFGNNDMASILPMTCEDGSTVNFTEIVSAVRERLVAADPAFASAKADELAAFSEYAHAFPKSFTALVDTYDTLASGVPNFLIVASALSTLGYHACGIRLDSGDLAHLSRSARAMFARLESVLGFDTSSLRIVASNDLNEKTLAALKAQDASIDDFLVGTNLVTCQSQPALGCVYKLVESRGEPRIKLSEEVKKTTIPGAKVAYRLYGQNSAPLLDLMLPANAPTSALPVAGQDIRCRHPFESHKRVLVTPARVEVLHVPVWKDNAIVQYYLGTLVQDRAFCASQVESLRSDHVRALNPTPYKVSVSEGLFDLTQDMLFKHTPEKRLS